MYIYIYRIHNWRRHAAWHRRPLNLEARRFRDSFRHVAFGVYAWRSFGESRQISFELGRSWQILADAVSMGKLRKYIKNETKWNQLEPKGFQLWANGRPKCINKSMRLKDYFWDDLKEGYQFDATWSIRGPSSWFWRVNPFGVSLWILRSHKHLKKYVFVS